MTPYTRPPTAIEIARVVAEHYGITLGKAVGWMRTPLHPGSMRDDFAAKALSGLTANIGLTRGHVEIAERAYELADAMLAERVK